MPMRPSFRTTALLALAWTAGCGGGDERLPSGLTQEEARALGVEQGIAGRAALRTGSCMPACNPGSCSVTTLDTMLWAVPAQETQALPPPGAVGCTPARELSHAPGFATSGTGLAPAGRVELRERQYALALPPGRYTLLLVDDAGCAQCAEPVPSGTGGPDVCQVLEVSAGRVVIWDLLFNQAAE